MQSLVECHFIWKKFQIKKKILENVREQILDKTGQLYEEIDFLLKKELREPDVYKSILAALASGHTKVVDIANASGIKVHDIDKYLKVLIRLGIIKKENLITTVKSKKTTYSIDDNFFSFSFSFSEPYKSNLEIGELNAVEETLQHKFNAYVGKKFEKLIREELIQKLAFMTQSKTGMWWGHYRDGTTNTRREIEIDIVALDEHAQKILFGECKWQNNVDGRQVLEELKAKTNYFEGLHKHIQNEKYYLIVAKSFKKKTPEKNVYYFDLKDLEKLMK